MEKIKVLIADDHPVFREGLCRFLEDEEDIEVVDQATDGKEIVDLTRKLKPDVAIIDVAMPRLNGIEAAKQVKEACATTAIIMLSAYDYEAYILASLRAGAAGYLLKDTPLSELVNAVRMVHKGEAVFSFKATSYLFRRITADNGCGHGSGGELHDREQQILKLVAKGMNNKDIGKQLFISERTVQTHLVNIFKKFGVGTRTAAVFHALKKGWITIEDVP